MNNFAYDNCEGIRRRWLRHIPNALTICNSLFGFAAILYLVRACGQGAGGEAIVAACVFSSWLIFSAMIFDAFDGFAARLLNAASMHGIQMDSLSDMVTIGVAPATMVAVLSTRLIDRLTPTQEGLIYVLCAAASGHLQRACHFAEEKFRNLYRTAFPRSRGRHLCGGAVLPRQ